MDKWTALCVRYEIATPRATFGVSINDHQVAACTTFVYLCCFHEASSYMGQFGASRARPGLTFFRNFLVTVPEHWLTLVSPMETASACVFVTPLLCSSLFSLH